VWLLISTYARTPHLGSERAVCWNWTTEAHRRCQEVWALVSRAHKGAIGKVSREDAVAAGIHRVFPEVPLLVSQT
jgi:hypothetical protein